MTTEVDQVSSLMTRELKYIINQGGPSAVDLTSEIVEVNQIYSKESKRPASLF